MDGERGAELVEVETIFGRILAFENDYITSQIRKFGAHTRTEIAFLLSIVRPSDRIFDLGAHIGTYAIPLAQKIGAAGKLLAVEARSENFRVLERNLTAADLAAQTAAVNALVGRSGQRYAVHTPDGNTGGTYFLPVDNGGVATEIVTIDELSQRYFAPRLIKLDIEGSELSALCATALLRRERPMIYCEVNNKSLRLQGASIGELEALFLDNGYRLFRNVGERHAAHDNFVVTQLDALPTHLNNFDVLAVHAADERCGALMEASGGR